MTRRNMWTITHFCQNLGVVAKRILNIASPTRLAEGFWTILGTCLCRHDETGGHNFVHSWIANLFNIISHVNYYFFLSRVANTQLKAETNVRIQWNKVPRHFIEFVGVETKQFVSSDSNVILMRRTCGQRSGMAAGGKRWVLVFYFPVLICFTFLISKCRK